MVVFSHLILSVITAMKNTPITAEHTAITTNCVGPTVPTCVTSNSKQPIITITNNKQQPITTACNNQ